MADRADIVQGSIRSSLGASPENILDTLVSNWQLEQEQSVSRAPLYHQLFLLLKRAILDGSLQHGTQVPTEHQLADAFGVSRITTRRAVDELAAEKLVRRQRGKGTHVIYQFRPQSLRAPMVGVLENFIQLGNNSRVRVVDLANVTAPADVQHLFGLKEGAKVMSVIRVSSTDTGDRYAYYQSWTREPVDTVTRQALERSSRLHLLQEGGLNVVRVEQILGAINAPVSVAAELDVEPGFALLSLRRLSYDGQDQLVDIVDCLYNPRRFEYAMELSSD